MHVVKICWICSSKAVISSLNAVFLRQQWSINHLFTHFRSFYLAATQPHILVNLDHKRQQSQGVKWCVCVYCKWTHVIIFHPHSYRHSGKALKFGPLKRPFCSSGTVGITIRFQSNPREDEVPRNFTDETRENSALHQVSVSICQTICQDVGWFSEWMVQTDAFSVQSSWIGCANLNSETWKIERFWRFCVFIHRFID